MAGSAFAQAQVQAQAAAQIKLKGDPAVKVGNVVSCDGRILQFQMQAGTIGFPLANVETITMAPPPEYTAMDQALVQRDNAKALQFAQAVATRFRGLPTDWAKTAYATAVNLLISKDLAKAKAMNAEMNQLYPGAGGLTAKVSQALISIEEKDMLTAKDTLVAVTDEALKAKNVPRENALAYSQAFYALGRVQEADGKFQEALENYLRTTTIFRSDPSSRAAAQEHLDALRVKFKGKKTSEQLTAP